MHQKSYLLKYAVDYLSKYNASKNNLIRVIKSKTKKPHVKFLGLEKSFLFNKKLSKIRKPIFYYTVKRKDLFKKYKNSKNLIFENL